MLKELSIANYKSINEDLLFSMEADVLRVSEHKEHILKIGNNNILKVTSMYGPNGGGKSNILASLLLAKNVFLNQDNIVFSSSQDNYIFNKNKIIKETIFFINDKYEIGYYFEIISNIKEQSNISEMNNPFIPRTYCLNYKIIKESVSYKKINDKEYKSLFIREKNKEIKSTSFDLLNIFNKLKLSSKKSVVNYLYYTFIKEEDSLKESFDVIKSLVNELLSINNLNFNNIKLNDEYMNIIKKNKKKLLLLLNNIDIKISDIKLYFNNTNYYPIFFERTLSYKNKEIKKEISLVDESLGTQKVFWTLVLILNALNTNNIYICDDMNAFLHPKLFREIIKLFTSKENKKSQLIFNSHDILNMDNELFRRDEIWFVYKDDSYATRAVPLSNVLNYKGEQVKKDAKYAKQYLEGKFGADPLIKKGFKLK